MDRSAAYTRRAVDAVLAHRRATKVRAAKPGTPSQPEGETLDLLDAARPGVAASNKSAPAGTVARPSNRHPEGRPITQPPAPPEQVPGSVAAAVAAAVSTFGASVKPRLAGPGDPEDQMRGPLEALLTSVATALGLSLVPHGESSLSDLRIRPDYAIEIDGAIVGYVEVKAPGKGADPTAWSKASHDRRQWEKVSALPNVLYTDGNEWGLYRTGERAGTVARLTESVRTAGAALAPANDDLARSLTAFLRWAPTEPRTLGQMVESVAGLCRLLRDEVLDTLLTEGQAPAQSPKPFTALAADWRALLFPGATDWEFADGYAQTVTFGLLLARVEKIDFDGKRIGEIANRLGKSHSLMGRALDVLTDESLGHLALTMDTLLRVIGAVNWTRFEKSKRDPYLYLYEHFLEVYDPELRKETGSYYTPVEVVDAMVRLTDDLLRNRLDKPLGFASDSVVVVDPAMGTGAYLLNIVESAADVIADEEGAGAVPSRMRQMAQRVIGFERQTGPYAVAELRAYEAFKRHQATLPKDGLRLYVADTLDNPWVEESHIYASMEPIARSRRAANAVKRDEPVLVVIGNPPYKDKAGGLGAWIEAGGEGTPPPLNAFRAVGNGKYEYVLSNLYVYFWRWAAWKVFDHHEDAPAGVISYITTGGYLTGPGFAGMREYLRRTADEAWIIDLTPEGHRPPVHTRIFPGVQQPLAIAIFVRYGPPQTDTPARVHYLPVSGHRDAKFARLGSLSFTDPAWQDAGTDWQAPFAPAQTDAWAAFPAVADLLPWQVLGVKPNRTWVYSPDPSTLRRRWERLMNATEDDRPALMKETRDRTIDTLPAPLAGHPFTAKIRKQTGPPLPPVRVGYRSFDLQWVLPDNRVLDYARPDLWAVRDPRQVFATEQHSQPINAGPALTFTAHVPDNDHFKGNGGGRVLPLYRHPSSGTANIPDGLLGYLADRLGVPVTPEDLLTYVAAVTAHYGYTRTFLKDLETPGVRVPLTADPVLWATTVETGRRVLWLHTRGERYADPDAGRPSGPPRLPSEERPKVLHPIPDTEAGMPEGITYDETTRTLHLGDGEIGPVDPAVWTYEVSGMRIIRKWTGYRQKTSPGRRSSPLDDVRPSTWPAEYTTDLLDLVQVLTLVVQLEPEQAVLLDDILSGPLIDVAALTDAGVLPVKPAARRALPPGDGAMF